jgi:hypothetical protein
MVGRIEIALAGLLGGALLLGLNNQSQIVQAKKQTTQKRKEVEVFEGRVREVNATGVMNTFSALHAVLIRKTWYMDRFHLANPDIRSLSAVHAQRNEKEILLEGNVTLLRTDGAVYEAEKVHYDQKKRFLRGFGPFYAHREEDYVRGYDFLYEVTPKITRARKVFAHYLLKEGGRELRGAAPKE